MVGITTNASCAEISSTTVAASSDESRLAAMPPSGSKNGCDSEGTIGTLVLVPGGADDAEVTLLMVTGLGKRAEDCNEGNGYEGCIVARRVARFVPHESVRLDVQMSVVCKDKPCASGQTCDERTGQCIAANCPAPPCDTPPGVDSGIPPKDAAVEADGTTREDASITDSSSPEVDGSPDVVVGVDAPGSDGSSADAAPDAPIVDAAPDANPLAACQAACTGGTCRADGTCVRSCDNVTTCAGVVCPPGLPCEINCTKMNACAAVSCGNASACVINCSFKNSCNGATACGAAASCTVNCTGNGSACASVDCPRRVDGICLVDCAGGCSGIVRCCDQGTCDVTPSSTSSSRDAQFCQ